MPQFEAAVLLNVHAHEGNARDDLASLARVRADRDIREDARAARAAPIVARVTRSFEKLRRQASEILEAGRLEAEAVRPSAVHLAGALADPALAVATFQLGALLSTADLAAAGKLVGDGRLAAAAFGLRRALTEASGRFDEPTRTAIHADLDRAVPAGAEAIRNDYLAAGRSFDAFDLAGPMCDAYGAIHADPERALELTNRSAEREGALRRPPSPSAELKIPYSEIHADPAAALERLASEKPPAPPLAPPADGPAPA